MPVRRTAGNFAEEVEKFILELRNFFNPISGEDIPTNTKESLRELLARWNTFLHERQGEQGTSAIKSWNMNEDINLFIPQRQAQQGAQRPEYNKEWIEQWLQRWNKFVRVRTGEAPVTGLNLFVTMVGLFLYIVDLVIDTGTAICFAITGQWWQFILRLTFLYAPVFTYTIVKWQRGQIRFTGAADRLRYVVSSVVNWPDLAQYGALCRVEWQLHKSPVEYAGLVSEWYERRRNVALLNLTEGLCEACPQAILQLCLLAPDMYGAWTWTEYLDIARASVSLCMAGAALVSMENYKKISTYTDLPPSEMVVLYAWAVPVTVSRLLSVALIMTVHPYWALAGVALHLVLYGVYWCRAVGVPRELYDVIPMCLDTLQFFMSPFVVDYSVKYRRVAHATHFLGNAAATVTWALGTPLVSLHPALYIAIIGLNIVMFAVGLEAWQRHEKLWPGSYL